MTTHHNLAISDPTERNTAPTATSAETGFWNHHGRPAPWPDDIDHWQPETSHPTTTHRPGQQPF
ncbi:hypothetical protein [Dactylosporangium sp. CA-233914]|uniref:hypothetical protein n=1 Tax=Dactylosporangium sp. CA-233914 TaxID=3239934 RepID=UPI003D9100AC